MTLSEEANEYMVSLTETYVGAEFPNHKAWWFDKGGEGSVHNELMAYGLIKMMGTRGSAWQLTDLGHKLVLQHHGKAKSRQGPMGWARAVFKVFQEGFTEQLGTGREWWIPSFDENDWNELGLSESEFRQGLGVLEHKGLVAKKAIGGHWQLTELGNEACLHAEVLDDRLAAPKSSTTHVDQSTNFNVAAVNAPSQFGNQNTQHVTYELVFQQLVTEIQNASDIPPEKKASMLESLKEIATTIAIGTAITALGSALGLG